MLSAVRGAAKAGWYAACLPVWRGWSLHLIQLQPHLPNMLRRATPGINSNQLDSCGKPAGKTAS